MSTSSSVDIGFVRPSERLPTELLSEIFKLATEDFVSTRTAYSQMNAPINILRVCNQWRDVALCESALWTTLLIFIETSPNFKRATTRWQRNKVQLAQFSARWGGGLPIRLVLKNWVSVYMTGGGSDSDGPGEPWAHSTIPFLHPLSEVTEHFQYLLPWCQRFHEIEIRMLLGCRLFDAMWTPHMASAKRVQLITDEDDLEGMDRFTKPYIDISTARSLEYLKIKGSAYLLLAKGVLLPSLTHLELDISGAHNWTPQQLDISEAPIYRILQQMTNLYSLSVRASASSPFTALQNPVVLPNVEQLKIVSEGWDHELGSISTFLNSIECPRLEELVITQKVADPTAREYFDLEFAGRTEQRSIYIFNLPWFVRRCNYGLKKLALSCDLLTSQELAQTLSILPNLQHLAIHNHIGYTNWDETMVALKNEWLVWQASGEGIAWDWGVALDDEDDGKGDLRPMCSMLETIVFRNCFLYTADEDTLDQFVDLFDARWWNEGSRLRSFAVIDCDVPEFDQHWKIRRIRSSSRYCTPSWGIEI